MAKYDISAMVSGRARTQAGDKNSQKHFLQGRSDFDFIEIETEPVEEGSPVYAFGYPLPLVTQLGADPRLQAVHIALAPRTTSAIVSSTLDSTRFVMTTNDSRVYVLDKALNYGNSGGPIVAQETGRAFAVCSRFQPVFVPQGQDSQGQDRPPVMIPSLYGVVTAVANVRDELAAVIAS